MTTYLPHTPSYGGRFNYRSTATDRVYSLSDIMDFDHVITVRPDGAIEDAPNVYATELFQWEQEDGTWVEELSTREPWELLSGFTGQYGYRGPMMHASEQIGGGLAEHIVTHPGLYVALYPSVIALDGSDADPDSWAVAYLPPQSA